MLNNNYNPRQYFGKNIVFLHYTSCSWKKTLTPVSMLLTSGSLQRMAKNNIDNWGKGNWFLPQVLPQGCLKNEKSKKKDRYYKHVHTKQILVIYYALWNKWPPPMTNACSWEEKQQIIQKETHNFMYNVTLLN